MWYFLFVIYITFTIYSTNAIINGENVGKSKNNGKFKNPGNFKSFVLLEIHLTRQKESETEIGYCGGTIIKPNAILTAAHCIPYGNKIKITAWAGIVHRIIEKNGGEKIHAASYHRHKEFDSNPNSTTFLQNDIAVILLEKSFTIGGNIAIMKLPKKQQKILRRTGIIPGWGYTDRLGNEVSTILQKTKFFVISDESCKCFYPTSIFNGRQFCAMDENRQSGLALGDSGGPFIFNDYLVGIVSFIGTTEQQVSGNTLILPDSRVPGIFTNVYNYLDWIEATLNFKGKTNKSGSSLSVNLVNFLGKLPSKNPINGKKIKSCTIL